MTDWHATAQLQSREIPNFLIANLPAREWNCWRGTRAGDRSATADTQWPLSTYCGHFCN